MQFNRKIAFVNAFVKKIRHLLLSKDVLVFFFFLLVSALFWFVIALDKTYHERITIPIRYVNVPQNIAIVNQIPSSLELKIKDKGLNLWTYQQSNAFDTLVFDFKDYNFVQNRLSVSTSAVFEKKIVAQAKALHPKTIILTDDLWGTSLRSWISKREHLKRKNYPKADFQKLILKTLHAGNDMFMITYPAKAVETIHFLEQLAKKNSNYRKQIEESSLKIILMKYNSGLLKPTNF